MEVERAAAARRADDPTSLATSFLMRFVSGMEYALLMRTTPSSSALAGPDGGSISANASSAADQMHRVNMDPPPG